MDEDIKYYNYKNINDFKNYTKGRIKLYENDNILSRYQIISRLGSGAFSDVYKSYDHMNNCYVALKIIKNKNKYIKCALKEIDIYNNIFNSDKKCSNFINLNNNFWFKENLFLEFDIGGINLYKYYKNNNIINIKSFATQILNGLNFIHSFDIIHADLKPENILVNNLNCKIIDLGSSFYENDKNNLFSSYIQSRWYRSPETVDKSTITKKIDIWSFGCIIYEIYYSKPLFPAKSEKKLKIMFEDFHEKYNIQNNTCYNCDKLKNLIYNKEIPNKLIYNNNILNNILLNKILVLDYLKRYDSDNLLKTSYFN